MLAITAMGILYSLCAAISVTYFRLIMLVTHLYYCIYDAHSFLYQRSRYVLSCGMHSGVASLILKVATRVTIDDLPEDVLLDTFDAYRQLFKLSPNYENTWNSRYGWFKLTHVCRSWRRLVHLSPSRLQVHLLFTPRRSSRGTILKSLPPLPILIDYCAESWNEKQERFILAAIRQRSRVREIGLRRADVDMPKLFRALSCGHPFPELEGLRILSSYLSDQGLIFPSTFLSGSVSCLQRLTLQDVEPRCLSPLLSSTTGLVELSLTFRASDSALPEASLISNLQCMANLRRLELRPRPQHHTTTSDGPRLPSGSGDVVPLPKLMQFVFVGPTIYLEALVVVFAAPSLQHLDAKLYGVVNGFPIHHLCRFICDTDNQFISVRLYFTHSRLKMIAETRSKSDHAQLFKISIYNPTDMSLVEICHRLSKPLTTVEEVVIEQDVAGGPWFTDPLQWYRFFSYIQQVKLVRVPSQVAVEVARAFQLDGQEPTMDLLPVLEQVEVDMIYPPLFEANHNGEFACARDAFEPLTAARKQVGRPITLSFSVRRAPSRRLAG